MSSGDKIKMALPEPGQSHLHFTLRFLPTQPHLLYHQRHPEEAARRVWCCNQSTMELPLSCDAAQTDRAALSLLSIRTMRIAVWHHGPDQKKTFGSPGSNRWQRWRRDRRRWWMALKHLLDGETAFVLSYTTILFLAPESGHFSYLFRIKVRKNAQNLPSSPVDRSSNQCVKSS